MKKEYKEPISPVIINHVHYLKDLGYSQETLETQRGYLKLAGEYLDKAIELYNNFYDDQAMGILKDIVKYLSSFDPDAYGEFEKRDFKKYIKSDFCGACTRLKKHNDRNIEKMQKTIDNFKKVEEKEFYDDMYSIFPDLKNGFASSKKPMPKRTTDNGREGL